jgi:hypothetical protein
LTKVMSKARIRGREMRLPASPLAEEQRLIYKEEGSRALALGHQRRRNGGGGWHTNGKDIWRRKHGQLNWSSRRGGGLSDMR